MSTMHGHMNIKFDVKCLVMTGCIFYILIYLYITVHKDINRECTTLNEILLKCLYVYIFCVT
jgi:hypothetical protein